MSKAGPVTADHVKSFADRVNNLLDEKQTLVDDVRDVYDEAKKAGVNATALRKVIAKRRAKAPDPTVAAAMEAYEHALDQAALMVSNGSTSLRKAAAESGFSKSAIQRQASRRNENVGGGTVHDDVQPGNQAHEGEENADDDCDHDGSGRRDAIRGGTDGGGGGAGACPPQVQPDRQPHGGRDQGAVRGDHSADDQPAGRSSGDEPAEAGGVDRHHAVRGAADAGREGELRPGVIGRGVDGGSAPPLGAVAEPSAAQRVAGPNSDDDWPVMPERLRRVRPAA